MSLNKIRLNKAIQLVVWLSLVSLTFANNTCPYGFTGYNCKDECGKVFSSPNTKIVGGKEAVPNSWPSMVYWEFDYKYDYTVNGVTKTGTSWSACGGSLIDVYTVLTAAHCIERFVTIEETGEKYRVRPNKYHPTIGSAYAVYVGLHDKSRIGGNISPAVKMEVEDVIVHWGYNTTTLENDIAIIKLKNPVTLNSRVQLACLPDPANGKYPSFNIGTWAVGWGTLTEGGSTPDKLQNVKMTIYNPIACKSVSGKKFWHKQICAGEIAGGKDTCQGDSGGPIFVKDNVNGASKYVLAGVTSFGDGCARKGKPGLYTRVSSYLRWINRFSG